MFRHLTSFLFVLGLGNVECSDDVAGANRNDRNAVREHTKHYAPGLKPYLKNLFKPIHENIHCSFKSKNPQAYCLNEDDAWIPTLEVLLHLPWVTRHTQFSALAHEKNLCGEHPYK